MTNQFVTDQSLLTKTTVKLAKLDSHSSFLQQCITQSKIPNGLKLCLKPSVQGTPSKRFTKRWNTILNTASLQLMKLLLSRTEQLSKDQRSTCDTLNDRLKVTSSENTVHHIKKTTETLYSKTKHQCDKRKTAKLDKLKSNNSSNGANMTKASLSNEKTAKRSRRFKRKSSQHSKSKTDIVVNLSSSTLSKTEEALLSKGLNFCPKPPTYDRGCLINDTESFSRKLRLKCHFEKPEPLYDNTSSQNDQLNDTQISPNNVNTKKFRNKSSWQPPKQTPSLETFISNVETDIGSFNNTTKSKNNISRQEQQALRSIRQRTDIVIKPADKGSAVVVMDREHYISEAERQLNDEKFYKKLDLDPTNDIQKNVEELLRKMLKEGYISNENFDYLTVTNPKPGRFYLLPKIHKPGNPGRPIVSANGHPTERISEFVDFHLRPHVVDLPSYVQDTTDYLKKLDSSVVPLDTLLVSMDVTSLYTNIPHDDGIEACREAWEKRKVQHPPTDILVELLSLVLKSNNFEFNGSHYLQIQGTAMGTKMAPSYANLFMGRLEKQLLYSVSLKPHQWLRFIDDIDMQWPHGRAALDTFLEKANNFHPSIKFTSEVSNDNHVFLDTVSCLEGSSIKVDLYAKPTDKHQYLLPTSCHPPHCCKNIPYSLALRIRRICTQESTFDRRAKELAEHLHARGYKKESVTNAISKAKTNDRATLLDYKPDDKKERIPFVLTYHPDLPKVRSIIDKHWPTIQSSKRLSKLFPEKPIIAYRRPKSLRDILVTAKVKPTDTPVSNGTSFPCLAPRCQTCKMITPSTVFGDIKGTLSSIKGTNTCKTKNAVYLMTCAVCHKQYVGETKLPVSHRINLHRSDWRTKKFRRSPVAEHFCLDQHSFDDIKLCIIETNQKWSDKERKGRETYWIRRLNTLQPYGINKGD